MHRERKIVVAGLLIDDGRILITQRTSGQWMAGKWEFPGGKLEAGESPQGALIRELREEIGVEVSCGVIWDAIFHRYPEFDVLLLLYPCRVEAGSPACLEVAQWLWVAPQKLGEYDVLEADAPLVTRLLKEGLEGVRWST